jgi:hypothetical protein
MIGWSDLISAELIQELIALIRSFEKVESQPESTPAVPSFSADIQPIFEQSCMICHGNLGGWNSTSYESVMNTGNHAPVIIPGDPTNSLLYQMLIGTDKEGKLMPPTGKLSENRIQLIYDWIMGGAPDN